MLQEIRKRQQEEEEEMAEEEMMEEVAMAAELDINFALGNNQRTITYNQPTPLEQPDGSVINQGQLKPTWQYIQSQLLVAALNITVKVLKKGGNFVAKIFKGSEINFLYSQFKLYFREVHIVKYLVTLYIGQIAAERAVQSIFSLVSIFTKIQNSRKWSYQLFKYIICRMDIENRPEIIVRSPDNIGKCYVLANVVSNFWQL